ncbi:dihydropyrimidinase [Intrasporangium sp.]|uniref:dihydropyrimidinase n=1 Tax=Intrasporangium sp. TaxID=1925024 RepID=UPI003365A17A
MRGGTVVEATGPRRADVLVGDGRIVAVGPELTHHGARVIEAGGAFVIPGGIDVHTHFALPVGAVTSADDFESGTIAAACGGTTCVVDYAGAGREPWQQAIATWHDRARERAVVDYAFHLTVIELPQTVEGAAARFAEFVARGITSVKLYLAYPDRLMVDDDTLARALAASRPTGMRVCAHAEDGAAIEALTASAIADGRTGPDAIPSVRPPSVEAAAIRRAAELARDAAAELYVVHLSSEAGLWAIRAARSSGAMVRAETCPHYLHLDASRLLAGDRDFVCAPPLRAAPDRAALWAALGTGEVEVVATDHCPFTIEDRRRGTSGTGASTFTQIPGGLSGVETRLSLVYQGVRRGHLSLERWVDCTSTAPARLFGLAGCKGSIRPGLDADLVVFDPSATRRLDSSELHSRGDRSPYEGVVVTGWPVVTLSRGRVVARDGEPAEAQPGWGRFIRRSTDSTRPPIPFPAGTRGPTGVEGGT